MSDQTRSSWIDEENQSPQIDEYARQLDSFINTFADGKVDESELKTHEQRVTDLMKQIEPNLDNAMHEKVTRLLCELTAYDIMQCFYELQQSRPQTAFRG